MPTYDYDCAACGRFEAVRRIAERDAACQCPGCGGAALRSALGMPALQFRSGDGRAVEGRLHDPEGGRYGGMRHLSNCACCTPGQAASRGKGAA